ncbi:TPA: aldo/keto reductase [Klebsiella pneumoniae]|nr:aldo/keto reductase [Klebsiella pneumoniae]
MNYTHLGRTGLKVSRLCLGTMNFGDVTDEKTSARILDEALEAGINFIDTADVYGTEQSPDIQQGSGLSEEIIGRWLQQGGRRERIVLATKVYQPMGPGPNDRRLSAYHIRKACEDSLRRLKTDHIDVYQMHHIDRHTPWEEIWQAMELLVQQGKVLYIGSSNFAGWDIATAQSVATARHCPTARSFLAGAVNPSQRFDSTDRRHNLPRFQPDALAKNMVLLEFAQSWARRKNTTPVQFALAWVMAQRPWIVPIPGTTQYPHLIENSGAPQVRLTDSELREIDAALAKIPLQGGRADPFTESQFDKS